MLKSVFKEKSTRRHSTDNKALDLMKKFADDLKDLRDIIDLKDDTKINTNINNKFNINNNNKELKTSDIKIKTRKSAKENELNIDISKSNNFSIDNSICRIRLTFKEKNEVSPKSKLNIQVHKGLSTKNSNNSYNFNHNNNNHNSYNNNSNRSGIRRRSSMANNLLKTPKLENIDINGKLDNIKCLEGINIGRNTKEVKSERENLNNLSYNKSNKINSNTCKNNKNSPAKFRKTFALAQSYNSQVFIVKFNIVYYV